VLEENVIMAGQTGSAGHITIHKDAIVWAQAGVGHDVPAGTIVSGSPAFEAKQWLRASSAYSRLPELVRAVRAVEARVKQLESKLPESEN
jgi:UDP-3-O-[3-hydroxymyristoyl] glucosamine N-acyltransferase